MSSMKSCMYPTTETTPPPGCMVPSYTGTDTNAELCVIVAPLCANGLPDPAVIVHDPLLQLMESTALPPLALQPLPPYAIRLHTALSFGPTLNPFSVQSCVPHVI